MRRASSTSTGTVRKLVAVGIERLSSMKRASVAAGPRIGLSSAPAGASGAAAPLPSSAPSTSSFVTRPRGPVPLIESRSTPSAPAMRAAIGVALAAPFPAVGVESARLAAAAGCTGPFPADAGRPSPAAMRHRTVPTATVESGSTRSSAIVPATGEGTSASTLSVEISTSGSSTATASPGLTFHSSTVPSATESPISGKATSTSSASAASGSAASGLAGPGATGPSPSTSISPSTAPTATVESGLGGDLGQRSGGWSGHLGVDLVGRDLDQRLVGLDAVADLLQPPKDGAFGDRLPHLGHGDLHGRRTSGHPVGQGYPVASAA